MEIIKCICAYIVILLTLWSVAFSIGIGFHQGKGAAELQSDLSRVRAYDEMKEGEAQ